MKNLLVILVILGIGAAYWYQLPEAVPTAPAATPAPAPTVAAKPAPFVAAHSVLEQKPTQAGGKHGGADSVLLGNDNSPTPARH